MNDPDQQSGAQGSAASTTGTPAEPIDPALREPPKPAQRNVRRRVIIKFRDGFRLFANTTLSDAQIEAQCGLSWTSIRRLEMQQHFGLCDDDLLEELVRRAGELSPDYQAPDFGAFYSFLLADPNEAVQRLRSIRSGRLVEYAYLHPGPVDPPQPGVFADNDPEAKNQRYLDAAPVGLDARYAWTQPGGDGALQRLVDIERGWNFSHDDLASPPVVSANYTYMDFLDHGTAVLGIICAADNAMLCVGFAPNASSVSTVCQWAFAGEYVTDLAVCHALKRLEYGDVLLIEAQTNTTKYEGVPLESEPAVFELIRLATALGIVVIEAAGNGDGKSELDLNALSDESGDSLFSGTERDSGAVIVSACDAPGDLPVAHSWKWPVCHGERVDCFAWGESVTTLTTDDLGLDDAGLTCDFGGTSAAAAMVAGAAVCLQGIVQAETGGRLSPMAMREWLSHPTINTPPGPQETRKMGVMPNLKAIVETWRQSRIA